MDQWTHSFLTTMSWSIHFMNSYARMCSFDNFKFIEEILRTQRLRRDFCSVLTHKIRRSEEFTHIKWHFLIISRDFRPTRAKPNICWSWVYRPQCLCFDDSLCVHGMRLCQSFWPHFISFWAHRLEVVVATDVNYSHVWHTSIQRVHHCFVALDKSTRENQLT